MKLIRNLLSALNPLAKSSAKKPASPFGGYKKRTMTAKELVLSAASLVPEAGMVYKVWVKHEIDAGFREELMLAVSKLNDCRYCSWGHHEWAHIAGIPEEELAHIEQMDPTNFDRKKWLAISFVRELVTVKFGKVSKDLMKEMKANYSAREIQEIILIAKVMDISNRGANTWDAMLSRLQGKPAAESKILDEAVLSAVFLTAAPLVVLFLARASKRPFAEVARSLIDYTKHIEAREAKGQSVR